MLTSLAKRISLSGHIRERLNRKDHPSELMKCWCGEMTPVYQPYAKHHSEGHGSMCLYCDRTVDEFYWDWIERVEYSNGSYSMKFSDGASHYCGNRSDNLKVVKKWERSMDEASKYALAEPDWSVALDDFPEEFQEFFIELLEILGMKEKYFSGHFKKLSERWKYEKLPQQIYDMWKSGDYYNAISRVHRNIPDDNKSAIIPHNPFLSDGEILIIYEILGIIREKQKELEPKDYSGGWRTLSEAESVLTDLERKIGDLDSLPSGYILERSLKRRSVSPEMMKFVLKYTKGSNVSELTNGLRQLSQDDLNEIRKNDPNREKELSVYIQWQGSPVVKKYNICQHMFVQDEWVTFTKKDGDENCKYLERDVANVGFGDNDTHVWLINQ